MPVKPTYSFRKGLDNSALLHARRARGSYLNFSGCGNSVNGNHPVVRSHDRVRASGTPWPSRGSTASGSTWPRSSAGTERGNVLLEPPVIEEITEERRCSPDSKMIAEPWDAGGLYQVSSFPGGHRWSVWNGHVSRRRPAVLARRARAWPRPWPPGSAGRTTSARGRGPLHSINFVTCHDGFTLATTSSPTTTSTTRINGEGNRDGSDSELLVELRGRRSDRRPRRPGPPRPAGEEPDGDAPGLPRGADDPRRRRDACRTQRGNNNGWCQDNAISHVDWDPWPNENAGFLRFVKPD